MLVYVLKGGCQERRQRHQQSFATVQARDDEDRGHKDGGARTAGVTRTGPATDVEDGGVRMDVNGMGRMQGTSRKAEGRTQNTWEGI